MKPTASELALIAAALSKAGDGDPSAKLPQAVELWNSAAKLLARMDKKQWLESTCGPERPSEPERKLIPLDTRLAQLLPKISAAARLKWLYEYEMNNALKIRKAAGNPTTEIELAEPVRFVIEREKLRGVAEDSCNDLPQFTRDRLHVKRSAAGRKGAAMKLDNKKARAEAKKRQRTKMERISIADEAKLDAVSLRGRLPD